MPFRKPIPLEEKLSMISKLGYSTTPMRSPSARLTYRPNFDPMDFALKLNELMNDMLNCKNQIDMMRVEATKLQILAEPCFPQGVLCAEFPERSSEGPGEHIIQFQGKLCGEVKVKVEEVRENMSAMKTTKGTTTQNQLDDLVDDMRKLEKEMLICKEGLDELVTDISKLSISTGLHQALGQPAAKKTANNGLDNGTDSETDFTWDSSSSEIKSISYEWL